MDINDHPKLCPQDFSIEQVQNQKEYFSYGVWFSYAVGAKEYQNGERATKKTLNFELQKLSITTNTNKEIT